MNTITYIFLILLLTCIAIFVYNDCDSLLYGISEIFNSELAGFPTSSANLQRIRPIVQSNLSTDKLTLIDFGCGNGRALQAFEPDFKKLIGIELNDNLAREAGNIANDKIEILNLDILDYEFPDEPIALYAYEPLWQVDHDLATPIYRKVIEKLERLHSPTYVIYLTGLNKDDMTPILEESSLQKVCSENIGMFYPYRTLHIYRSENAETKQIRR